MLIPTDPFVLSGEFVNLLKSKPIMRKRFLIVVSVAIIFLLIILSILPVIMFDISFLKIYFDDVKNLIIIIAAVAFYLLFLISLSYTSVGFKSSGIEIELKEIMDERGEIKKKVFEQPPTQQQSDILNTIELNLNHLNEYYVINKNQAKNSFKASLIAISIGFITLITGIWFFYLRNTPNLYLTALSCISGILIEVFGGTYLIMYKESQKQLNYFFEKLYQTQNTMLALKINSDMDSSETKVKTLEKIISTLLPSKKE